jgi:uncharacterized protein (TIGR02246 family)
MNSINNPVSPEESAIRIMYKNLLQAWNNADAKTFASFFATDANVIGFDGSQMNGSKDIESQLAVIFKDHKTGTYISLVREVRFIADGIAILQSVAGMVPHGQRDINPAINAVQTAVIQKQDNKYRIQLFQNTPAAFHGRSEEGEKLSKELRKQLEFAKDAG